MKAYTDPTLNLDLDQDVSRRSFMGMLIAASAVIAINPLEVFSSPILGEDIQKAHTQTLVSLTCNPSDARRINQAISYAPTYVAPVGRTFHESFMSRIRIDVRVLPTEALSDRYFELNNGLPFFDSENPCRRIKDLNAVELFNFTHPDVVRDFGVLSPCNERLPATARDMGLFRETAEVYGTDPDSWDFQYKRPVQNGKKNTVANVVTSRTRRTPSGQPAPSVLITPFDLFS